MKPAGLPTLCIGIDVAWWGGSRNKSVSQRDTIVAGLICENIAVPLSIEPVELKGAPNDRGSEPTEPNYDRDGQLLIEAIDRVLNRYMGRYDDCVLALDAPLEARCRRGQPPRKKAVRKGDRMFAERRACEDALSRYMSADPANAPWNQDVKIQPGSPIAPRIARICSHLSDRMGFTMFRPGSEHVARQLLEIFPSEAIWALGCLGAYARQTSTEVRAYKAKHPSSLVQADARTYALRPLQGFVHLIANSGAPRAHVYRANDWIEQIARHAGTISTSRRQPSQVDKGKGYDDPIESGIAFLTALMFIQGEHHVWGDGSDGTIVGPGRMCAGA